MLTVGCSFKGLDEVKSYFWQAVLKKWIDNNHVDCTRSGCTLLGNNRNVTCQGQVYLKDWIKAGIMNAADMMTPEDVASYTSHAAVIFIWGVSLTHSVLASFLSRKFLLHIPCRLHFYVGSFSYTSHADFVFMWGVSLTHRVLASFLSGEFLLNIPCWLLFFFSFFNIFIWGGGGGVSYTSHAGFIFFIGEVSLTHPVLASFFIWEVSLVHPVLAFFFFFFFFFFSGEFLLHIPCWIYFSVWSFTYTFRAGFFFFFFFSSFFSLFPFFHLGSFSYTFHVGFTFLWGVSRTHPLLTSYLCGEFLLHIPFCLRFYPGSLSDTFCADVDFVVVYLGSFSYTSRAGLFCLFLLGEFLLHIPCWVHFYRGSFSYTSRAGFIFILGVSLTHPVLASFFIYFLFIFIWGVSLTHPMLDLHPVLFFFFFFFFFSFSFLLSVEFLLHILCWFLFLLGEFLLHIPCWVHFYRGCFFYTSRAGFFFVWGVSLTPPVLCGVSLTHPSLTSFLCW